MPPPQYLWQTLTDITTHRATCHDCDWWVQMLGNPDAEPESHVMETGHTVTILYQHLKQLDAVKTQ